MARTTDTSTDKDAALKRLGGGRWQTRDERFTIEPQSGTWAVVDAEQTDDLGLPLVRGPFASLGAAKAAIGEAREAGPPASPLAARSGDRSDIRSRKHDGGGRAPSANASKRQVAGRATPAKATGAATPTIVRSSAKPEAPPEPRWIQALEPADRRRAKRLVERLGEAGADDPEGIARRDIVGEVPAAAAFAIVAQLNALGDAATPAQVARLLAGGRDEDLGVRWHLVDGDGRPITIELER